MQPLTDRQADILKYLIRATADGGRPPSQVEIAAHFGLYQSGIRKHLLRLAELGHIAFETHSARGIRVLVAADDRPPLADQLPLLGRIAAGTPMAAAENVEEWPPVNPELFRPRATHLFRVSGRPMLNIGVLDGDFVAIHEDPDATSAIVAGAVPDKKTDDLLHTLKRYAYSAKTARAAMESGHVNVQSRAESSPPGNAVEIAWRTASPSSPGLVACSSSSHG